MERKLLVLKTDEDVKMVFDPFRKKIVTTYLEKREPLTSKQIATIIDEAPAKVNYHIKKLVGYGTLVLDHTENINGILAKFYKCPYDNIVFRGADLSNKVYLSQTGMIEDAFGKLSQKFRDDLHQHLELVAKSKENAQRHLKAMIVHMYMTKEEQEEFLNEFEKLTEKYLEKDDSKEVYSMLHTMARIK